MQIEGEIRTREYVQKTGTGNRATEVKKSITEVRVTSINKLDRPGKSGASDEAAHMEVPA